MRIARYGEPRQERPYAAGSDGVWRDLSQLVHDVTGETLATVLGADLSALPAAEPSGRIGPPLGGIGKVICVGLNYRDHAAETGAAIPAEPILFMKAPDTVVGPTDPVRIPPGSTKTDWEIELAVVIGKEARYLAGPDDADACIAGYAISHDVSEREYQLERGGQWDKGKNCETFNPFGPFLVSADEVGDPQALRLRLSVNGVVMQDGSTADMIFGVRHLVWYISQFMVLRPGDVINTGTPAGVALGRPDAPYLRVGDVVEIEIEGLGTQRQDLVQS
jgi:2-keto-4-pentenoate hydratase/2-oxohepta-3-ene-1,7-dioic acid hydratase in catechol pathway